MQGKLKKKKKITFLSFALCVYRAAVLQAHKSHTVLSVPLWAARCGSKATKGFAPRSPMGSPRVCRGSRHPGAGRRHQSSPDIGRAGCPWKGWLGDHTAVHCPRAAMPKTPWENKAPSAFPVCSASFVSGCCGQRVGHEVLRHARAVPAACGCWPPGAPSEEQCFGVTAAMGCLPCQEAPCSDAEGSKHPP